jgi:hypothetical protein
MPNAPQERVRGVFTWVGVFEGHLKLAKQRLWVDLNITLSQYMAAKPLEECIYVLDAREIHR